MASTGRQRGRRYAVSNAVVAKHEKAIKTALKKQQKAEADLHEAKNLVAQRLDEATRANISTTLMSQWMGLGRQQIYKLMRLRVDKKSLGTAKPPKKSRASKH